MLLVLAHEFVATYERVAAVKTALYAPSSKKVALPRTSFQKDSTTMAMEVHQFARQNHLA